MSGAAAAAGAAKAAEPESGGGIVPVIQNIVATCNLVSIVKTGTSSFELHSFPPSLPPVVLPKPFYMLAAGEC